MSGFPRYWWLLALACAGQGLFFLRPAVLHGAKSPHPAWAVAGLAGGGLAGLAFGWVQSDAVFLLGQAAALLAGCTAVLRGRGTTR